MRNTITFYCKMASFPGIRLLRTLTNDFVVDPNQTFAPDVHEDEDPVYYMCTCVAPGKMPQYAYIHSLRFKKLARYGGRHSTPKKFRTHVWVYVRGDPLTIFTLHMVNACGRCLRLEAERREADLLRRSRSSEESNAESDALSSAERDDRA